MYSKTLLTFLSIIVSCALFASYEDPAFPSGYGQITGGANANDTYANLAVLVENRNINTILFVNSYTGFCTSCDNFRNKSLPGIAKLCKKYGLGVHTWNNGQYDGHMVNFSKITRSCGVSGTSFPSVALVPNPRNMADNTNTWYYANVICNFDPVWFSSDPKSLEFPSHLESILKSYTNTIQYVDQQEIYERISETTTPTELEVLDFTTYVSVYCPTYATEGTSLIIRLRRSGSVEFPLTVHVLESDILVKSVTWKENDNTDKYVSYFVEQREQLDDNRALNFSIKSLYRRVLLK